MSEGRSGDGQFKNQGTTNTTTDSGKMIGWHRKKKEKQHNTKANATISAENNETRKRKEKQKAVASNRGAAPITSPTNYPRRSQPWRFSQTPLLGPFAFTLAGLLAFFSLSLGFFISFICLISVLCMRWASPWRMIELRLVRRRRQLGG